MPDGESTIQARYGLDFGKILRKSAKTWRVPPARIVRGMGLGE